MGRGGAPQLQSPDRRAVQAVAPAAFPKPSARPLGLLCPALSGRGDGWVALPGRGDPKTQPQAGPCGLRKEARAVGVKTL